MFFKKIKNSFFILLLSLTIIPYYVKAYSDYIIAGGENIGIELNSKGVIIVGSYEVNNTNPAKEAGLLNGDKIIKINDNNITNIEDMLNVIETSNDKESINITYQRGNKELTTTLNLIKSDNNVYKTGLYVKDSITGVGTLTYIDPNTKLFGALGHEIIEKNTGQKLEIKDGKRKTNLKKVFPGYVLIKMIVTEQTWYIVRNTRGVTGFVGSGTDPIPLTEDEIRKMGFEISEINVDYDVNDSVQILNGPFKDSIVTVQEINKEKHKVKVLISMFGRETPVDLELSQVQKVK